MSSRHKADDLRSDRWRTEPRLVELEFDDAAIEKAPPLWKDLMLASALALVLWAAAVLFFN